MAVNDAIIWIYLAKRDKTGIQLLTQLKGKKIIASRLENVEQLRLPTDYTEYIKKSIYDNRMLYEPWIESASNFLQLRSQLKLRGYSNLPVSNFILYGSTSLSLTPDVYSKGITQAKSMLRKAN